MPFGKLQDLARIEGMPSEASLRRFIAARPDFPLLQARQSGQVYLMDLDAAATFVRRFWADGRRGPGGGEQQPHPARLGKLCDLVALPGMPSAPSMRRFIASRADFPLVEQGGRGHDYLIDLDAAAAFVTEHWRDGRNERRRKRRLAEYEATGQFGLLLPLLDDDPAGMGSAEPIARAHGHGGACPRVADDGLEDQRAQLRRANGG